MRVKWAIALAGMVWITSCYSGPRPGTKVIAIAPGKPVQVEEQNYFLARKITVGEVKYRNIGGLSHAQVELINQTDQIIILEGRAVWYDQPGFAIPDPKDTWREIIINPQETKAETFVAPNSDGTRMELTVREGNFKN